MSLINCNNITLSYDSKPVIADVTFTVNSGDYLCIVGENGAGKSTLTAGILGLLKPVKGIISYSDDLASNEIGYLPQQTDIQKNFPASVKETVISGCLNKTGIFPFYTKKHKEIAENNMRLLGIDSISDKYFSELSGGQQQRVLLARALCATGKLLILDEPVSGLDPMVTNELYSLVSELNQKNNISVIMVSHDVTRAIKYATHILHLEHNNYFFGTVDEYRNSLIFKKFFGNE